MSNINNLLKILTFVILFSFNFTSAHALSSDWSVGEASKLRLISPYSQNQSSNITIGLEYKMDPGWKTYWKSPGDGGFAQIISWNNSTNIKNINVLWPTPIEFEILGLTSLGYKNNVIFPLDIEIEDISKDTFINLHINYLICEKICIPGDARIFLEIPAGEKKLTNKYFNVEQALSLLPEKNFNSSYLHNINTNVFKNNDYSTIQFIFESEKKFYNPEIFLHTPFGLPVVEKNIFYSSDNKSITVDFNYENSLFSNEVFPLEVFIRDKNHNFEHKVNVKITDKISKPNITNKFFYYLFISLIAGLILNVMPCVFPILSIKLMSVFKEDNNNPRVSFLSTAFGIIISFLLLGLLFLILQYLKISIAWGMQFQQPYFLITISLIMFLFMMNMFGQFEISLPIKLNNVIFKNKNSNLYLKDFFNGFFATLMATPCSAPFVGTAITAAFTQTYVIGISIFLCMGIGMSLPYLIVASFPKLIYFLPKPGKWMIYLKYFLGLLLFVTVLWLLNILLNFYNYYFIILLVLLFLILTYRRKISSIKYTIIFLVLLIIYFSSSLRIFQQSSLQNYDEWTNFFDVNIDQLIEQDQIIFLDITADWCATCQYNKINVLNSKSTVLAFKENNITLVRADWTKPNDKVNVFLEKYDRFGIPFNAFFAKNFPNGILLSELLSEKEIVNAIKQIKNE